MSHCRAVVRALLHARPPSTGLGLCWSTTSGIPSSSIVLRPIHLELRPQRGHSSLHYLSTQSPQETTELGVEG